MRIEESEIYYTIKYEPWYTEEVYILDDVS